MKNILIILFAICGCMIISSVTVIGVFASKTKTVKYSFDGVLEISVYDHTLTAKTKTKDDADFVKMLKSLVSGLSQTKLTALKGSQKLYKYPRVLEEQTQYTALVKDDNLCVGVSYEETQTVVLYQEDDTKQIKFTDILIVFNGKKGISDHIVYYGNSQISFSGSFLLSFDETKILKFV